ncbi:MAG TPA: tRNA (guanosine(37)-N1)-methyltransferase TrmD [Thermoguttaceae bacterium]|nr:tRNA (guanosine(37)-N1)-methyltransferase TrmD [Thermoguttaceae bacterium]
MRFDVLTLFPEMFSGYVGQSLLRRAIDSGLVEVHIHNIRDWSPDKKHKKVDDRPYGGGPGMVLRVDCVVPCVEAVQAMTDQPGHLVMLTPQGRRLTQTVVRQLAGYPRLLLLCGRYEGFDERIRLLLAPDEISIGDYVLSGGETAAMVIMDAVSRLVPGVVGDPEGPQWDSFSEQMPGLEFAQYTRPREYRGLTVPSVLLSGDHARIAQWRQENSVERTQMRRADLFTPSGPPPTDSPPERQPPEQPGQATP